MAPTKPHLQDPCPLGLPSIDCSSYWLCISRLANTFANLVLKFGWTGRIGSAGPKSLARQRQQQPGASLYSLQLHSCETGFNIAVRQEVIDMTVGTKALAAFWSAWGWSVFSARLPAGVLGQFGSPSTCWLLRLAFGEGVHRRGDAAAVYQAVWSSEEKSL